MPITPNQFSSGSNLDMGSSWWTPSATPRMYTPTLSNKPEGEEKVPAKTEASAADIAAWEQTAPEGYSEWTQGN